MKTPPSINHIIQALSHSCWWRIFFRDCVFFVHASNGELFLFMLRTLSASCVPCQPLLDDPDPWPVSYLLTIKFKMFSVYSLFCTGLLWLCKDKGWSLTEFYIDRIMIVIQYSVPSSILAQALGDNKLIQLVPTGQVEQVLPTPLPQRQVHLSRVK